MWDIFSYSANAILPIMLLIALGWGLRRIRLMDESFFSKGNRLLFRVVLPVQIFTNIYTVPSLKDIRWNFVGYGLCVVLLLFLLGLAAVLLFIRERGARGVLLQCVFRSNFAIIGLPLSKALGGDSALQVTSLMVAFTVPVFNVLAVVALSAFGEKKKTPREVLTTIAKNPLILSCLIGLAVLGIRGLLPVNAAGEKVFLLNRDLPFLYTALQDTGKACTFLALVVLGGLLDFSCLRGKLRQIAFGTVWRVILAPAIGLGGAVFLNARGILSCGPGEFACYIAMFGSPVAVSSAIMAAEMDADAELARQLVLWTSLCPIVTLFCITSLFRGMGLI